MIYDHERDAESHDATSVADWGGDDLFSSVPRRRLKHASSRPRRYNGPVTGAHPARRPEPVPAAVMAADEGHDGRTHVAEVTRFGGRAHVTEATGGSGVDATSRAGRSATTRVAMPQPLPLPAAVAKAVAEEADPLASFVADLAPGAHPAQADADDAPAPAPAVARRPRRDTPALQDRIALRPDRIAGWAVGLGITLILIAVGTADGGAI